ncbi:class I adenylate-forming enzyme family protein [Natrinema gelatinilyticum]|uniref:class I adenylate-forming enzyme family protein n=1 Tax=Natrinema gelatinilyticum TaxID=2961571 RepID=UPI0020C3DDCF|nr:AMP-binding protein [Natrinema gelatinilyticum]
MDIGRMISESADRFGNRLAVACQSVNETRTRTFEELEAESNQIANGLLEIGIGTGDVVAIYAHNSIEFVETFFATQKVGAIVMPINVRLDASDVEYVLEDADPTCLIADSNLVEDHESVEQVLASYESPLYTYGDSNYLSYEELVNGSTKQPGLPVSGETIDGYFYTSGSTGKPKGVVHTHSDRVLVCMNMIAEFGLRHTDVNVLPLPLFHSGPLYTGFVPFIQFGVPTVIFEQFDPEATLEAVEEWDATVLGGVPAQYDRITKVDSIEEYDLSSLRFWWFSGAPMTDELIDRCRTHLCDRHSVVYGATEVGPPISVLPPEQSDVSPRSCGTGFSYQQIEIVDPDGEPDPSATVPPGTTGEIICKGASVMNGYLNRPERTTESIVDGWYFTGDLAYKDEDGYIYVEGRKDDMIISGGENIYPTEIENVLLQHDDLEDVAVVSVDHDEWGQAPKAYVVPTNGRSIDEDDLVEYCRESSLADYKRPRAVATVPEIPRNPSGGSVIKDELRELEHVETTSD